MVKRLLFACALLIPSLAVAQTPLVVSVNTTVDPVVNSVSLPETTGSGIGVIIKNGATFLHDYHGIGNEGRNLFIGPNAGNFTMGGATYSYGSQLIGIGENALSSVTVGQYNIALGHNALHSCTSCFSNGAIGQNALGSLTSGFKNFAWGTGALASLTTGQTNITIGDAGMRDCVTCQNNVGIGQNALLKTTTGGGNVALGIDTLTDNLTGQNNVAVGSLALNFSTTPSNNTALGYRVGYKVTTGSELTLLGSEAGYTDVPANAVTSGVQSVYVGVQSGPSVTAQLNNAIAIGYRAKASESNQAVFGNTSIAKTVLFGLVGYNMTGLGVNGSTPTAGYVGLNGNLFLGTAGDGVPVFFNNARNGAFTGLVLGENGPNGFRFKTIIGDSMELWSGNEGFRRGFQSLYDRFGTGDPEGVVTAPVGAVWHRTDGGACTSVYFKESGAGSTGWVPARSGC